MHKSGFAYRNALSASSPAAPIETDFRAGVDDGISGRGYTIRRANPLLDWSSIRIACEMGVEGDLPSYVTVNRLHCGVCAKEIG